LGQTKLNYLYRKNQDLFGSFLNESSVKLGHQDYFGAIESITKAININNKYPIPFIRRAEIRFTIKDYKNANNDLSEAFKLKKNCPENYLFRAYFLAYSINKNLENSKDAIINLEKSINLMNLEGIHLKQKYGQYLYEKKGDFLRESGKNDQAISEYSKAIGSYIKAVTLSDPISNTRLHYKRGWLNYHESNYAYAINDFSIAIKKAKQIDKYHYFMARGFSLIKINNLEAAFEDFKNALEFNQLAIEFYKEFFLNFVPKETCDLVVIYFGVNLEKWS
tara:strand:+ start:1074 stop:1907 length:834 start_codon:yes stop_codon:yes gene_type:complete